MKLLLILIQITSLMTSTESRLVGIREVFGKAEKDQNSCEAFLKQMQNISDPSATEKGYLAAALTLSAKFSLWPMTQLNYFNEGKTTLEKMIQLEPENAELKYIRYTIQVKTPAFLGYKQYLDADKKFLLSALPKLEDRDLKKRITAFLLVYGQLNEQERSRLK